MPSFLTCFSGLTVLPTLSHALSSSSLGWWKAGTLHYCPASSSFSLTYYCNQDPHQWVMRGLPSTVRDESQKHFLGENLSWHESLSACVETNTQERSLASQQFLFIYVCFCVCGCVLFMESSPRSKTESRIIVVLEIKKLNLRKVTKEVEKLEFVPITASNFWALTLKYPEYKREKILKK